MVGKGTRHGRLKALAVAITAIGSLAAAPAQAQAAVNGTHVIAPLYITSGLELSGYGVGVALDITVSRNGIVIGHATGTTTANAKAPTTGDLTVNPGACWIDTTPEILPGDVITVAGDGPADTMTVQDNHGRPSDRRTRGPTTSPSTEHFRTPRAPATDGRRREPAQVGHRPLRPQRRQHDPRHDRLRRRRIAELDRDVSQPLPRGQEPRDDLRVARRRREHPERGHDLQNPGAPGPSGAPCTAPLAQNEILNSDHLFNGAPTINIANGTTDLTLSGIAQANASTVTVTLSDGTNSVPVTAILPTPTGFGQSWSTVIPMTAIGGLADGQLTASLSVTLATATSFPARA